MTEAEFTNRFDIMARNIGNYSDESPIYRRQRERDEKEQRRLIRGSDTKGMKQIRAMADFIAEIDPFLTLGIEKLTAWTWGEDKYEFLKSGLGRVMPGNEPISNLFLEDPDKPYIVFNKPGGLYASFNYNIKNVIPGHRFYQYYPIMIDFQNGEPISMGYNHYGSDKGTLNLRENPISATTDEMIRFFSMYFDNGPSRGKK